MLASRQWRLEMLMTICEIVTNIKLSLSHQHHCSPILPFMEMEYLTKKLKITAQNPYTKNHQASFLDKNPIFI